MLESILGFLLPTGVLDRLLTAIVRVALNKMPEAALLRVVKEIDDNTFDKLKELTPTAARELEMKAVVLLDKMKAIILDREIK